jgi:sorbitol/mannitol transport system permease protein
LVIVVLCLINPIVVWMLFTYFKDIPKDIIEVWTAWNTWGEMSLFPLAWGDRIDGIAYLIFCWNEAYWTVRLTTIDAATLSKLIENAPEGLFFVAYQRSQPRQLDQSSYWAGSVRKHLSKA